MIPPNVLRTTDRALNIVVTLEENACELAVSAASGEGHSLLLTFTKGFTRELRDFLNANDPAEPDENPGFPSIAPA